MKIITIPFLLASALCTFAEDPSWEKYYNGPANAPDHAEAVALDAEGNAFVTGLSTGTSGGYDVLTTKFAAKTGRMLWQVRYNGPNDQHDRGVDIAVDFQGNVLVAAQSIGANNNYDYYTAKYASNDGSLIWEQRFDGGYSNGDYPAKIALDAQGNAIVTGWAYDYNNYSYCTVKYAATDGAILWVARHLGGSNSYGQARAVDVDSQGHVIVTGYGYSYVYSGYSQDIHTLKYDGQTGGVLWHRIFNGSANSSDEGYDVAVDGDDNVCVAGMSYVNHGNNSDWDFYAIKYSGSDGATIWEKTLNSPGNGQDYGRLMALTPTGDVCITGESYSNYDDDYSGHAIYTAMLSGSDGEVFWEQRYNVSGYSNQYPTGLAMDSHGNPVIAGYYRNYLQNYNAYRILGLKLDVKTGDILWKMTNPYLKKNYVSRAAGVAIDQADYVFLAGYATGKQNSSDYLVMKCGPLADGLISNTSGSKFLGDDVYNKVGAKQTTSVFMAPGSVHSITVLIQNDAPVAAAYKVQGAVGNQNVSASYTNEAGQDITNAVRNGTYHTQKLGPGKHTTISMTIRIETSATGLQIVPLKVRIGGDDTVKALVWIL